LDHEKLYFGGPQVKASVRKGGRKEEGGRRQWDGKEKKGRKTLKLYEEGQRRGESLKTRKIPWDTEKRSGDSGRLALRKEVGGEGVEVLVDGREKGQPEKR